MPKVGKYGKLSPRPRVGVPRLPLAGYALTPSLPAPPAVCRYDAAVTTWPMYGNDTIGDCTCAAAGHLIEVWTAQAGAPSVPLESAIVGAYSAITGYDPATGANDTGALETDVLAYWQNTGIAGNEIDAYASLQPADLDGLKRAVWLFGGVYLGIEVRQSTEQQFEAGEPWDYVGPWLNPIEGFHAVPIVGYDAQFFYVCTWGAMQRATPEFVAQQADEAYAIVDAAFIGANRLAANQFDLSQLQADLSAVSP
jgi:hypothetical protein